MTRALADRPGVRKSDHDQKAPCGVALRHRRVVEPFGGGSCGRAAGAVSLIRAAPANRLGRDGLGWRRAPFPGQPFRPRLMLANILKDWLKLRLTDQATGGA